MSAAKAKTINLLLYDGNLSGVISIEDSSWNSGELYSAPRENVDDLLKTDACNKFGVYLLLSTNMVYIGQASDLAKRITQHIVGKDWWESVVILTTKDDSLTHSDIDYLEAVLIEKAYKIGSLDVDNKNKGNKLKVDKFRKVYLGQYLDEALFLMQLIGISVFSEKGSQGDKLIKTIDTKTKLTIGTRAKAEALSFLNEKGFKINNKNATYAIKNSNDEFWANPQEKLLLSEWWIILNDNKNCELIILRVPKDSFKADHNQGSGLKVRSDKPNLLNIHIDADTLTEVKSGISFAHYVVDKVSY